MDTASEPAAGFDPMVNWGTGEHVHEPLIQSTLITTDTDMNFVNDLATSYECSADGLQWTFTIRNDVKFTDGVPLTAKDVAFTINGIIASAASETDLSSVEKAEALDDTTVVITMKKPNNALLYTLAVIGIVPEHAYGPDYGEHPIGSGRYMLEQWDRGQQVILVANPDYYGEAPKMQRVVIAFMGEDAALAAAKSGQADIVYTSATYSNQQIKGYSLLAAKSVDSRGISLPTTLPGGTITNNSGTEYAVGNAVTSDIAIRQAINLAIDRENMIDNVLNGYGSVAYSVCDGMPWASADMKVGLDRDKARVVLEDAGWSLGADVIYTKDGLRASFDLWYPSSDSVRQALANEFSNQMKEIGLEVVPRGGSWDDIYPNSYSSPVLWGWGSNSPSELYSLYYSSGTSNFAQYLSSSIDGYLDAALATPDIADSYVLWQKAQWDGSTGVAPQGAATWAWLVSVDHLYFYNDNLVVAKQKLHPHGYGWSLLNNVDQWTWRNGDNADGASE
jgi:peptide/nickel transport system substrate-binding protein